MGLSSHMAQTIQRTPPATPAQRSPTFISTTVPALKAEPTMDPAKPSVSNGGQSPPKATNGNAKNDCRGGHTKPIAPRCGSLEPITQKALSTREYASPCMYP